MARVDQLKAPCPIHSVCTCGAKKKRMSIKKFPDIESQLRVQSNPAARLDRAANNQSADFDAEYNPLFGAGLHKKLAQGPQPVPQKRLKNANHGEHSNIMSRAPHKNRVFEYNNGGTIPKNTAHLNLKNHPAISQQSSLRPTTSVNSKFVVTSAYHNASTKASLPSNLTSVMEQYEKHKIRRSLLMPVRGTTATSRGDPNQQLVPSNQMPHPKNQNQIPASQYNLQGQIRQKKRAANSVRRLETQNGDSSLTCMPVAQTKTTFKLIDHVNSKNKVKSSLAVNVFDSARNAGAISRNNSNPGNPNELTDRAEAKPLVSQRSSQSGFPICKPPR